MTQEQINDKAKTIATVLINQIWDQSDNAGFDMNTPEGAKKALRTAIGDLASSVNTNRIEKNALLQGIEKELDRQAPEQLLMETNDPADDMRRGNAVAHLKQGSLDIRAEMKNEVAVQAQRQGAQFTMGSHRH